MTSVELNKKINILRKQGGEEHQQDHYDLVKKIVKEFGLKALKVKPYKDAQGQKRPMLVLTDKQAKQILMSEGKIGRKYVVKEVL